MKQLSLAATDFIKKPKQTRREKFLAEMETVVPWARLLAVIEPVYPKAGNGRRPYELPTMLRIASAPTGVTTTRRFTHSLKRS